MRKSQEEEKYIVNKKGTKTDIIIPLDEYEELLEDLHDLAIIAERREEPTLSLEELKKKLRADDII
jgi:ribosome-binding protein aMBF1 (putative translation factor)